ncbi:phage antirepressor protein [Klebsiella pneumoniae subsp. pneumoniae]|nr:phage antirepressor protein [Klebsiella pneumoniae subsp. pneumoniae]
MNSLDFLNNIINPARIDAGENPHEPRKFLAKIEDELDLDRTGKNSG